MTEGEWLAGTDLYALLAFLRDTCRASDRRFRLFAVACCRRPYYRVADERHRRAVQLAERMADEDVGEEEGREAHQAARELWHAAWMASLAAQQRAPRGTPEVEALVDADMAAAAGWAVLEGGWEAAYQVTGVAWKEHAEEPRHQLALLRDVFGNPFRPVTIEPSCRTAEVAALAQAAYADRRLPEGTLDNARLAVLADALEEAGCSNAELLRHLRAPGPHVRGCHGLDAVLGKS